jgi:hypothetical protein
VTFPKKKLFSFWGLAAQCPAACQASRTLIPKRRRRMPKFLSCLAAPGGKYLNDLWGIVENYYNKRETPSLPLRVNFENVLGEMIALAYWVTPAPLGNMQEND